MRKDGTKFWSSIVITPLRDDESGIIGFSKVSRDLTERKIAEDQLKNYALDIEFRNKQLEEYAYIASHDLQEPLKSRFWRNGENKWTIKRQCTIHRKNPPSADEDHLIK